MHGSPRRPVVLVVDDDLGVREALRALLEEEYEPVLAADGAAALDIIGARPVDLMLLDVMMPGLDGLEILQRLQALRAGLKVVVVSAVDALATAVAAMKRGAVDYVTKPFDNDALLGLVRRVLCPAILEVRLMGRSVVALASLAVIVRAHVGARVEIAVSDGSSVVADTSDPAVGLDRTMVFVEEPFRVAEILARVGPDRPTPHAAVGRVVEHAARRGPGTTVDELAAALRMSRSHLSEIFRRETALTLKEYLSKVQAETARYFLEHTDESEKSIARKAGYSDASHFCRRFLEDQGVSPGAYRRQIRRGGMS